MSDASLSPDTLTEALLRRDRWFAVGGVLVITLLAWLFVLDGAGTGMSVRAMTTWQFPPPVMDPEAGEWSGAYWLVMLVMWWVMMVAMMTPSAAPMILLYARVYRHHDIGASSDGNAASAAAPTAAFAAGYLLVWLGFSLAATAAQWLLEQVGLVHGMLMWSLDRWLTAALLLAAGIWQLSPLKDICLRFCRAPASFLSRHYRPGHAGAFRLGVVHGAWCVGCCWALMALLFAGGIMNLVWIAGLTLLVLLEKLAPHGQWVARITGVLLVGASIWVAAAA